MRSAYIRPTNSDGGCRGGVGGGDYSNDYALEIGSQCNADLEMLALCCHVDEVMEFMSTVKSPIGQMLYRSILKKQAELDDELNKHR